MTVSVLSSACLPGLLCTSKAAADCRVLQCARFTSRPLTCESPLPALILAQRFCLASLPAVHKGRIGCQLQLEAILVGFARLLLTSWRACSFEQFDELVLLKRGGETIYCGPLGKDSRDLIAYFEVRRGPSHLHPAL